MGRGGQSVFREDEFLGEDEGGLFHAVLVRPCLGAELDAVGGGLREMGEVLFVEILTTGHHEGLVDSGRREQDGSPNASLAPGLSDVLRKLCGLLSIRQPPVPNDDKEIDAVFFPDSGEFCLEGEAAFFGQPLHTVENLACGCGW